VVFRINKDCVIRTGSHARLAADADRFVEINNAVGALEHRGGRASGDAWRVRALIAASDLMGTASLRKDADVYVLHIRAGD
jgi:hypothetical protein